MKSTEDNFGAQTRCLVEGRGRKDKTEGQAKTGTREFTGRPLCHPEATTQARELPRLTLNSLSCSLPVILVTIFVKLNLSTTFWRAAFRQPIRPRTSLLKFGRNSTHFFNSLLSSALGEDDAGDRGGVEEVLHAFQCHAMRRLARLSATPSA